jgi:hypothetical protein
MSVLGATIDFDYGKLHPTLENMMHDHLTKDHLSKIQRWQYWVVALSFPSTVST